MTFPSRQLGVAAAFFVACGLGCQMNEWGGDCNSCQTGENTARRWSSDWYEQESQLPDGARQFCSHGKLWPPFARPTGKHQQFSHRFHSAHYWPYPYNCQDRAHVRNVSATQINNGWTTATTLYDYHFNAKDNTLNHAGRLHLKWILQTIPERRRFVWVQSTESKPVSEARLAEVRKTAEELAAGEKLPPIMLRVAPLDGRPSDEVNRIRTLEAGSMPMPRLPTTSGGSGGMGGSGGSSGGGSGTGSY